MKGDGKTIYKVYISKKARKAINSHVRFLARVNINASQKLFNKFLEKISSLDFMPNRGQVVKLFIENRRKLVINKKFIILYSIYKNVIYIENIINAKMKSR